MDLEWPNLGLDWRTLGLAALSARNLDRSALGAWTPRLV